MWQMTPPFGWGFSLGIFVGDFSVGDFSLGILVGDFGWGFWLGILVGDFPYGRFFGWGFLLYYYIYLLFFNNIKIHYKGIF